MTTTSQPEISREGHWWEIIVLFLLTIKIAFMFVEKIYKQSKTGCENSACEWGRFIPVWKYGSAREPR